VQLLAESRDGRTSGSSADVNPFVVIPERDPSTPRHSQDHLIRVHLANQRTVIVKAYLDGPQSFSKEEIGAAKGALNQRVQWHGELKSLIIHQG
jgi:hypothetical protein